MRNRFVNLKSFFPLIGEKSVSFCSSEEKKFAIDCAPQSHMIKSEDFKLWKGVKKSCEKKSIIEKKVEEFFSIDVRAQ